MNFVTLEPEEFRKFADKCPYKSFYQTPEIAKLREQNGWVPYYFGVVEAGRPSSEDRKLGRTALSVSEEDGASASPSKIVAAAMVVARPTFLGKSTYYCPGGPLLDYEDAALTSFFFKHLRHYAKTHNGYLLHIEPYYELIQRDRSGEVVAGGFNHTQALKNLKNAGLTPCVTSDEPKYAFVLDLNNRTPDTLFKQFKQNTRNLIHRAENKGVKVRELKREELGIFKQITESTSHRRNFQDKPLSYYQQMYDLFHKKGQVKFLVAEVEVGAEESKNIHSRHFATNEEQVSEGSPVTTGRAERVEDESFLTPLSAAMFMLYGDEVTYLFSGSDEKYMKEYNAQYLIQWHMISHAAKHKFKRYNFYGLQALPNKSKQGYGLYTFKKGFASDNQGHVTELLGAHEAPVNTTFYALYHLLHILKSKLHK